MTFLLTRTEYQQEFITYRVHQQRSKTIPSNHQKRTQLTTTPACRPYTHTHPHTHTRQTKKRPNIAAGGIQTGIRATTVVDPYCILVDHPIVHITANTNGPRSPPLSHAPIPYCIPLTRAATTAERPRGLLRALPLMLPGYCSNQQTMERASETIRTLKHKATPHGSLRPIKLRVRP